MKFTTLIPTTLNDGSPATITPQQILASWAARFGGCTYEGMVQGHWIHPVDQTHYQDECARITVICDNELYDAARDAVIDIGRRLGQKAMYFEVRDFDGVRILKIL